MLTQKLMLSYGSKLTIQFLQIVAGIIVARIAGPSVLGTLAFGLSFVSIFSFIAIFWGPAHIKLVSEGKDLGKCISTFSVLVFFTTILFIVVVITILLAQNYFFGVKFESPIHQYVIFIFLFTIVIQQLLGIAGTTFLARTEQAKHDIPELIRMFICQLLRITVVILGFRAIALASANLVSTILIIPLFIILFKDYPRALYDKGLAIQYVKIAIPFLLMALCHNSLSYLDKIILQYFTSAKEVGYYTAGWRGGGFFLLMTSSVGTLFFPLFSKAATESNYTYIKKKVEQFERFGYLFVMPTVIFIALYSDVFVKFILGNQYIPSISILSIITVAMFVRVISNHYGTVLTGMGFFNLLLHLNLINLVFFVITMITMVHPKLLHLGGEGMAYSVLLSNLFIGILFRIYAKRKCRVLELTKNLKFVVWGIVSFLIFLVVYNIGKQRFGYGFQIAFPLLFFVANYLFLVLFKWINRDDWQMFFSLMKINKVIKYIKDEIHPGKR